MKQDITFEVLTLQRLEDIALLAQQLNPKLDIDQIKEYIQQMFKFSNYTCFGLLLDGKLNGISSAWTTVKIYSGKQLEVDNVIIDTSLQSQGLGKVFFEHIESWAKSRGYQTIELNTYVQNSRSHKFYFNLGYTILGFHFWKSL